MWDKRQGRRTWCLAGVIVVVGWGWAGPPVQDAGQRQPLPPQAARAKSLKLIHDVFAEDLKAAQSAEAKTKLAAQFVQQARESRDEPANRYVLYEEAVALAAAAGDAALALAILAELGRDFEVDLHAMRVNVLAVAAAQSPSKETSKTQVELLLPMVAEAVDADQYATALKLLQIAEAAARKARDIPLLAAVQKRTEEVADLQKRFARQQGYVDRLKEDPKDPEANLELGKYFAVVKGRWERALPLLALGGTGPLP
ncbi:MAG: hypothetical protein NZO58_12915, partial [Gemmataceae bacterium]|nr:hypothetical protein [Gemmataceae bacterium]